MRQMLRDSWRAWRRTPVVACLTILSLALGIGALTASYALVDALLLRSLDVPYAHRLVTLTTEDEPRFGRVPFPVWQQLQERASLCDACYAWASRPFNFAAAGAVDMRQVTWASGGVFKTLGIESAAIGRLFDERDDVRGGGPDGAVAVISHEFWLGRFSGARDVVGRTLTIERTPFTIIGVAPRALPGLAVNARFDAIVPLQSEPLVNREFSFVSSGRTPFLSVVFRLRPGQGAGQLRAALQAEQDTIREATIANIRRPQERQTYLHSRFLAVPAPAGRAIAGQYYGRPAVVALCIGAFVLLACCGNAAMVLLAHGARRRHELGVRIALGASRRVVARQLLVDGLALTVTGAVLGLAGSLWASPVLASWLETAGLAREAGAPSNWRVWLFASSVGVVAGLCCSIAAAWRATRLDALEAVKAAGPRHRSPARAQSVAIVLQLAASVVAVVTSGVLLRSYLLLAGASAFANVEGLSAVELQFQKSGVVSMARPAVVERIELAVHGVPNVTTALAMAVPLYSGGYFWSINAVDRIEPSREQMAFVNAVSPSYFELARIGVLAGRRLDGRDVNGAPRVGVVNRLFARRFLGGESHVPQHVSMGTGKNAVGIEVVGVVDDLPDLAIGEPLEPALYLPRDQDVVEDGVVQLLMRSTTTGPVSAAAVSAAIAGAAPDVSFRITSLEETARDSIARERLLAALAVFFVVLTGLVAVLGVFGIVTFEVTTRRREFGVRLAVGAQPWQVAGRVLARAGRLCAVGVGAGLLAAWWATSLVSSMLTDTAPRDPAVFIASGLILGILALMAAWWPAIAAARIDPAETLRAE